MHSRTRNPARRALWLALPLALILSACAERQTPLPGERQALFPGGVPGVDFNAPPPQPANSNIPIGPAVTEQNQPDGQQANPQQAQATRPAGDRPSDAWSGAR